MKIHAIVTLMVLALLSCSEHDPHRERALESCIFDRVHGVNGKLISYHKKKEQEIKDDLYWAHVKIKFHNHLNEIHEKEDTIHLHSPEEDTWNCHNN